MKTKSSNEVPFKLNERGILWQIAGFAIVGVATTSTLAIYSEANVLPFRFLEIATTKLSWAFVPAVAFIADRSRKMFETRSEIREAARRKVLERGKREEKERIRSELEAEGVVIPPEVAERVFNHKNGKES